MDHSARRTYGLARLKHLGLAVALTALPIAAAESGEASGAAEYREHVMAAIGGHMQSTVDILRRKVPHQDHLRLHTDALADMAGIADTLFPQGSEGGEALPAIWESPDDFAARLDDFEAAAVNLKAAVDEGGNIGAAVQELGQACKSCHDDFRDE